jgi:hypothetical protein
MSLRLRIERDGHEHLFTMGGKLTVVVGRLWPACFLDAIYHSDQDRSPRTATKWCIAAEKYRPVKDELARGEIRHYLPDGQRSGLWSPSNTRRR